MVESEVKQMKTLKVYRKENYVVQIRPNKTVPCLLFVTMEMLQKNELKISIRGKENPLPFKEAIIQNINVSIDLWLSQHGYIEIGRHYVY